MEAKLFTKSDVIRYAHIVSQYELLKFRFDREKDLDVKIILKQQLDDAYEKLNAIRESLGL